MFLEGESAMREIEMSRNEEILNALLHGIGLGLAVAALVVLVVMASLYGTAWHKGAFLVYGITLIILYLSSTLYHIFPPGTTKNILRIIDHSAIFLLIAGTYTPFTLILLRGPLGWTIFGLIWGIALLGITGKIFWMEKFSTPSIVLYLLMGWLIVLAIRPLIEGLNTVALMLLIGGGLFYTVGLIFYSLRRVKYHHAVWHVFVLAGSVSHFFTVLFLLPD